ncbi:related to L-fucose permease [Phialocephala subalpina]|uniref:Related to L-fucose permease n=1 Tax=Phialocephala subalpina TaxID=576137 RepID=A0A1L7X9A0_9HELO|nr:related to L-fucose permease [Phialocephala subalpina]
MPPLSVLLEWPTPNYIDPVMRGPANLIVIAIFFPLVLLFVGIRIYTRIYLSKSFGLDDWFIIATLFPTTAFAIFSLVAELHFGWNRHIWDVKLDTITIGLKIVMATEILFCFATSLTKISMLILVYRLVSHSSTLLSKIIIGAITLVSAQGVAFCFSVLLQCRMPSLYWTLSFAPQPECVSETKLLLAAGIVNTITDAVVVILPMPTVWRVKLPVQQQIILVMLFAAGFFITLVGAIRTYYLYKVTTGYDKTWEAFPVWLASSVELYVGIICASIPATKRFFGRFGPNWLSSPMPSRNPTSLATHTQRSSHRHSYPQEEEIGVFPLQEYHDDKKAAGMVEGFDTEATYNMPGVERPETACSKGSDWKAEACGVRGAESREDLVPSYHAS